MYQITSDKYNFDEQIHDFLIDSLPGVREDLFDDDDTDSEEEEEIFNFLTETYGDGATISAVRACRGANKTIAKEKRSKSKIDGRGKHDKAYREQRRIRLIKLINSRCDIALCPNPACTDPCIDQRKSVCISCGHCTNESFIADAVTPDCYFTPIVVYNSNFYFKERINNWRKLSPVIPMVELEQIYTCIKSKHDRAGVQWSVKTISRNLIYEVVNDLYGHKSLPWKNTENDEQREENKLVEISNKSNRRKLVYRERWIWIKYFMCEKQNKDMFRVLFGHLFVTRFDRNYPTDELIALLEIMIQILDKPFKDTLFSSKRLGLRRHNRPSRDVVIIYLLYGIHPALTVIYGTDYWQPPKTTKSLYDNETRFKLLLEQVKEGNPQLPWPPVDINISTILSLTELTFNFDSVPNEIKNCFPYYYHQLKGDKLLRRIDCVLP